MAHAGMDDGRRRTVIEAVTPEVDGGRFPVKRTRGETVIVEADVFCDGHEQLLCVLLYRHEETNEWDEAPMEPLVNDRWRGQFPVTELGRYRYTVIAWADRFFSWRHDLKRRVESADIELALRLGADLVRAAAQRAAGHERQRLGEWVETLIGAGTPEERQALAQGEELAVLMRRHADRSLASSYERELPVVVDRERARFGSWYEAFPRSASTKPGQHGTFKDLEARLPYISGMGFDILYMPPVHPIGRANRKGPNNVLVAGPEDPGSPWAIGAAEGGHTEMHPQLGSLEDFQSLRHKAEALGLELAVDIAFQCAPDHPWVQKHPKWFRWRADGSIQYAENPPKKYQDIYPLDFESEEWKDLWLELRRVVLFWAEQGVQVFRVDNPHTKPFGLWEWLIAEVKKLYPEAIFLAEAFTRPKVMHRLAKAGFTQSYTYFTWRNTKWELTQYFTELTQSASREYFRPNPWPNTPDILNEYLQIGGRPAFIARLVLAATLAAAYGIYGPAFELAENIPREPGSEEYLNSEKYQLRHWNLEHPESLRDVIGRVNRIRRENPALQSDWSLQFHPVDNEALICYSKRTEDLGDVLVMVVNLDPFYRQSGFLELPLEHLGVAEGRPYQVHDLLWDARYLWHGARNYVELDPRAPAHIFRVRRWVRTERDFDYYM